MPCRPGSSRPPGVVGSRMVVLLAMPSPWPGTTTRTMWVAQRTVAAEFELKRNESPRSQTAARVNGLERADPRDHQLDGGRRDGLHLHAFGVRQSEPGEGRLLSPMPNGRF